MRIDRFSANIKTRVITQFSNYSYLHLSRGLLFSCNSRHARLLFGPEKEVSMYNVDIKELRRNAIKIESVVARYFEDKGAFKISANESTAIKEAVKATVAAFTGELDDQGLPKNPIDRAVVETLIRNEEKIKALIERRSAEQAPGSIDYYSVFYEVMKDSGILHNGLPHPQALRQVDQFRNRFGLGGLAEGCDACGVCGACGACGACGLCPTGVGSIGTAGTAGTLGAGGALSYIF